MKSLKQLLDTEAKELSSWYNKYRSNLIHLLESIDIDTIYGMPSYRLLIPDEFDQFYSLFASLAPKFTHKDLYGCNSLSDVAQSDTDSDEYMEHE